MNNLLGTSVAANASTSAKLVTKTRNESLEDWKCVECVVEMVSQRRLPRSSSLVKWKANVGKKILKHLLIFKRAKNDLKTLKRLNLHSIKLVGESVSGHHQSVKKFQEGNPKFS